MRILVVDDEAIIRRNLAEGLRDAGHDVDTATDGIDALNVVSQNQDYDLMFVDLIMPKVNGVDFLLETRRRGKLNCPVVMVTGHYPEWRNHMPEVRKVMEKPVTIKEIIGAVGEVVGV